MSSEQRRGGNHDWHELDVTPLTRRPRGDGALLPQEDQSPPANRSFLFCQKWRNNAQHHFCWNRISIAEIDRRWGPFTVNISCVSLGRAWTAVKEPNKIETSKFKNHGFETDILIFQDANKLDFTEKSKSEEGVAGVIFEQNKKICLEGVIFIFLYYFEFLLFGCR